MSHSPEPWTTDKFESGGYIADANGEAILYQDDYERLLREDADRIVACVNACAGIPDIKGVITMIGDMKVAILTGDQEMAALIRRRLLELDGETANAPIHAAAAERPATRATLSAARVQWDGYREICHGRLFVPWVRRFENLERDPGRRVDRVLRVRVNATWRKVRPRIVARSGTGGASHARRGKASPRPFRVRGSVTITDGDQPAATSRRNHTARPERGSVASVVIPF